VTAWALSHRDIASRPKLTEKDTIVLADFENKTGDPVFDDTLRQGLSIELQQPPVRDSLFVASEPNWPPINQPERKSQFRNVYGKHNET
jgi:hypothetical protein